MNLPFFIARRYLVRHKGAFASFIIKLAILATALSVAVMIVSMAFISGFKYAIHEKLFSFWGHVMVEMRSEKMETEAAVKWDEGLAQKMRSLPHVQQVTPFIIKNAILHSATDMDGMRLKGINDNYRFAPGIDFKGGKIDFSDTGYAHQIVVSEATAARLHIKQGDMVELYFIEQGNIYPRIRKVKVAGFFHTGMEEVDKHFAICDIRLLQRINNWQGDDINAYQLTLDDDKLAVPIADKITDDYLPVASPLAAYSMKEVYPNIFDWIDLQDVNVVILLIIMSVVAIINLAAVLLILMVDRARLIGLLKALGMPASGIKNIFLSISAIVGVSGIVLGNVIGLGFCYLQEKTGFITLPESTYYVSKAAVHIIWWQILLVDVATLVICVLCMWLPALYIRRISAAKVLQFK